MEADIYWSASAVDKRALRCSGIGIWDGEQFSFWLSEEGGALKLHEAGSDGAQPPVNWIHVEKDRPIKDIVLIREGSEADERVIGVAVIGTPPRLLETAGAVSVMVDGSVMAIGDAYRLAEDFLEENPRDLSQPRAAPL